MKLFLFTFLTKLRSWLGYVNEASDLIDHIQRESSKPYGEIKDKLDIVINELKDHKS